MIIFFFSTFAFEAISIIKHITHLDPAGDSVASKPGLKVISASLCSNQHDLGSIERLCEVYIVKKIK